MDINYVVYEIGHETNHRWQKVATFEHAIEAIALSQDLQMANLADKEIGAYDPDYRTRVKVVMPGRELNIEVNVG